MGIKITLNSALNIIVRDLYLMQIALSAINCLKK